MLHERTWLLIGRKMAGEASSQELTELEEILRTNPELHFSLDALSDFWQHNSSPDNTAIQNAYQLHLERMKTMGITLPGKEEETEDLSEISVSSKGKLITPSRIIKTVSFALLALAVLWISYYPSKEPVPATSSTKQDISSQISTRNGSKTNIVLPDGTKVWLNSGSKLTYDKQFDNLTRDVVLTGEAYFDVVHNPDKPFIIHTRAMDIKVLGTEFNVKSYPDERTTETSLIRGSIEVTLKDKRAEKIMLKPNEKLVITNEEILEPTLSAKNKKTETPIINLGHIKYFSLDSTILETSWVENRMVFEDESFGDLAKKMERWYGVTFSFADNDVQQLRFTGNFQNETIEEALSAMQITAAFRYRVDYKKVTITK